MPIPVNQPPIPEPDVPKTDEEREALRVLSHKLQWDMMQCIPDGTNIVVVFTAFLRGAMDAIDDCPDMDAKVAMLKQAERKVREASATVVVKDILLGPILQAIIGKEIK